MVYIDYSKELENIEIKDKLLLYLGRLDEEKSNSITGLAINASTSYTGIFPSESFSIVELSAGIPYVKGVFGKLTKDLFLNSYLPLESLIDSYGLYCDNVYLKGSLITENKEDNESYMAGVSTNGLISVDVNG